MKPSVLNPEIPRRAMVPEWCAAEHTIAAAIAAVERMPADPILTDAVVLLGQAQARVADYIDSQP